MTIRTSEAVYFPPSTGNLTSNSAFNKSIASLKSTSQYSANDETGHEASPKKHHLITRLLIGLVVTNI